MPQNDLNGDSHWSLQKICAYLAVGDRIRNPSREYDLSISIIAVATVGYRACDVIMDSGFRPKHLKTVARIFPPVRNRVQIFKEKYMYNGPLSLHKLAANIIRSRLRPNAVVGAKILMNEGKVPKNMLSLTLGLTKEDMYTRRNWCPCTKDNGYILY